MNILRLFRRPAKPPAVDPALLELQSQVQRLTLDLQEKERACQELAGALERQAGQAAEVLESQLDARMEALLHDAAGPVTQLLTQADLLEQGKTVLVSDALALAKKVIKTLQANGLELTADLGETTPYDPEKHLPLNAGAALQPGQPVRVRFVGVGFRGRVLRKALVEPVEAS